MPGGLTGCPRTCAPASLPSVYPQCRPHGRRPVCCFELSMWEVCRTGAWLGGRQAPLAAGPGEVGGAGPGPVLGIGDTAPTEVILCYLLTGEERRPEDSPVATDDPQPCLPVFSCLHSSPPVPAAGVG